jgi:hypothetical protein
MRIDRMLRTLIALFSLSGALSLQAASLSGTVTRGSDGTPMANVTVTALRFMFPFGGLEPTSTQTDALGKYQFPALAAGLYYVDADALGDSVRVLYPEVPCPPQSCAGHTFSAGVTQFTLQDAQPVIGVDFAIRQGGQLQGQVRRADTLATLAGRRVTLLPLGWELVSDASGAFQFTRVPEGTWRLRADGDSELSSTLHPNLACDLAGCSSDISPATAVALAPGVSLTGLDIAMPIGARISGLLQPVSVTANREVVFQVLHSASPASRIVFVQTGADGSYVLEGLAPGSYQILVSDTLFRPQVYPNIACVDGCDDELALGTPIATSLGQTSGNRDFMLTPAARVDGLVTDAATSQPLAGVEVIAYIWAPVPPFGLGPFTVASDITAADGSYQLQGIQPRAVKIATRNAFGYRDERYDNILCAASGCLVNAGSDWPLDWGDQMVANFALQEGASLFGRVTLAPTPNPPVVRVEIYDLAGVLMATIYPDPDGSFHSTGLASGPYRVRALTYGDPNLGQVYGGMNCVGVAPEACDIATGQILQLAAGVPIELIFEFTPVFVDGFE